MSYTCEFSEMHKVLDRIPPSNTQTGGISTIWMCVKDYHRVFVFLGCGNMTNTLDVAVWQATNAAGAGAKIVTGKTITQLAGGDDNEMVGIELRTEELDVAGNFDYIRVQTLNGGTTGNNCYELVVFGCIPRFAPVGTTEFDEIVH
ncbi:MAG: hypothetical protein KKD77_22530 [Gammaproteobacteria bacterium]|nr:hypothetical protein [Gammaproteobacteria bacterium]